MSDTNTTDNQDDPKDLRTKLEAALAEAQSLKAENAGYKANQQLESAGFGHLSARQRKTILRDLADEGKDITAESVKELAEEHGYPVEKKSEAPPPAPDANAAQAGDEPVSRVEDALTGFEQMNTANQAALSGQIDPNLEQKLKGAKSIEEVRSIIRKDGAKAGIVHSWDVV